MTEVNELKRHKLSTEYFPQGMSIILSECKTEDGAQYFTHMYNHEEGRKMEHGQFKSLTEAISDYEDVMVTYF